MNNIENNIKTKETIGNHCKIIAKSLKINENHSKQMKNTENHQKSLQTYLKDGKSLNINKKTIIQKPDVLSRDENINGNGALERFSHVSGRRLESDFSNEK